MNTRSVGDEARIVVYTSPCDTDSSAYQQAIRPLDHESVSSALFEVFGRLLIRSVPLASNGI